MIRAALLTLLLAAAASAAPIASGGRAGSLAAEVEAARGRHLYLLLDPRGPHVDLKASGVLLHRFPVESALFGSPRLGGGDAWPAASFQLVSELPEPERPEVPIQKAAPREARTTLGDPVAEANLEGVPTHYRLRFAPDLDLSVLGEAGSPADRLWRLRHRLLEGWGNLARRLTGEPTPPRVVLFMKPEDARRLFVAIKPDTRLVVRF
jgi:hypothetical protein